MVVHDTEGGTALSVATFFHSLASRASVQLVFDDDGCYRCLPDLMTPWGAPGANLRGLHAEHCARASWTRAHWLAHAAMLKLSAEHTARWCWQYKIPRRWVGPWGLKLGRRGLTTHADATRAFPPNDGHTDPGPGFPKDAYLALVKDAYAALVAERQAARARAQT